MRKKVITLLAVIALCVTAAPAQAAPGHHSAPAVLSGCSGSYKWAWNSGASPDFWYTQWVHNYNHCQQRSSGLCASGPSSSGGTYRRGGWVYSTTIESWASCTGTYPFLRALWIDIRVGPCCSYVAYRLAI